MQFKSLTELLEHDDVAAQLNDTFVQLSVPARHRELAERVILEAEAQGSETHQVANDYGNVTLTIAFDAGVLE